MSKSPFFSVIIPTYNCADFLKRALTSVFIQTYQNFEVIVVDNSSTDNTEDVLNSFGDKKLAWKKVNNNGIIAHSRNKGIENANGDWIAFLDSDDVWNSDKLMQVKNAINQNPKVILICHDEWRVVNGERKNHLMYGPAGNDLYERLLFKSNCLSTSAVCLRKDVAMETGGFSEKEEFVTAEDYEYWIRLSQEGKFHFINEALGEWHIHDRNDSVGNPQKHVGAIISVNEYHFALWLKNNPSGVRKVKKAKARVWANTARILQNGCLFPKARMYSVKSIYRNPFQWKAWLILLFSLLRLNYPK